MKFRVGTRGSKLALKQTEIFIQNMKKNFPDAEFDLCIIKTKGDKILDAPFSRIPHKGLFVKDIEDELLKGNIDFAVHSLKDVPLDVPEELSLSAFLERENPADVIIGLTFQDIMQRVRHGLRVSVGTSSLRREYLLREIFGDLNFVSIRGNVDTRINKVMKGECDCIVLALAGVLRLGIELSKVPHEVLDPRNFLYSPGQGIIVVETRKNTEAYEISKVVDNPVSRFLGEIERGILRRLGGGCSLPLGVFSEINAEKVFVKFKLFAQPQVIFEGYFNSELSCENIIENIFKEIRYVS